MALAFGPLILLTIVGAAVFGGFDPRKKKKTTAVPSNGEAPKVVECAHIIDISTDGTQVSVDAGAWQPGEDFFLGAEAVAIARPIVSFVVCKHDAHTMNVIRELCDQLPNVEFYGMYFDRMAPGPGRDAAVIQCAKRNSIVEFAVSFPVDAETVREYTGENIPELNYLPGGNLANVIATVMTAAAGDPHANAYELYTGADF